MFIDGKGTVIELQEIAKTCQKKLLFAQITTLAGLLDDSDSDEMETVILADGRGLSPK